MEGVERLASDARTRLVHYLGFSKLEENRVVLIDIDETSLAKIGPWPWPREVNARLISELTGHYQVTALALDMVFPEVKKNDHLLASALRNSKVETAIVYGAIDQPTLPPSLKPNGWRWNINSSYPLAKVHPVAGNHSQLQTDRIGHINPHFDSDGVVRYLPAVLCAESECHAPLSLALWVDLLGDSNVEISPGPWWGSAWQMKIGKELSIPINKNGYITIPYRHSRNAWVAVPAYQILLGQVPSNVLSGKIAILGATALGLSDTIATPLSPTAAGMEPHAELFSALLDESYVVTPQYSWIALSLMMCFFSVLVIWLEDRKQSATWRSLFLIGSIGGVGLVAIGLWLLLFIVFGYAMPITPLILFFVVLFFGLLLLEWLETESARVSVQSILKRYIPAVVAQQLVDEPKGVEDIDAKEQVITVLYADILGFTSFAEGNQPEVIASLTQKVFQVFAQAITNEGGTIDKYMGDSVLAFWNAPDEQIDHAQRALAAANNILAGISNIRPWASSIGFKHLQVGIGIESGLALVGHFGSQARRTYTALGEPVVLATRIEELTRQLDENILLGGEVVRFLNLNRVEFLQEIFIRGRVKSIKVYRPR